MRDEDAIDLPDDDFRRLRRYLAPWVFFLPDDQERTGWPPPTDLIAKESWDSVMDRSTDVALKSSSYEGGLLARLDQLHSDWIYSWPEVGTAPTWTRCACSPARSLTPSCSTRSTGGTARRSAASGTLWRR